MSGLPNESDEVLRGERKPEPCQAWTFVPKETLAEADGCDPENDTAVIAAVKGIKALLVSVIEAIEHPQPGAEHAPKSAADTLLTLKRLLEKEFRICLVRIEAASRWIMSSPLARPRLEDMSDSAWPDRDPQGEPEGDVPAASRAIEALWHPVAVVLVAIEVWEAELIHAHDRGNGGAKGEKGNRDKKSKIEAEAREHALGIMESLEGYLVWERHKCARLIDDALERLGRA